MTNENTLQACVITFVTQIHYAASLCVFQQRGCTVGIFEIILFLKNRQHALFEWLTRNEHPSEYRISLNMQKLRGQYELCLCVFCALQFQNIFCSL